VAYTVRCADLKKDIYLTDLWLAPTAGVAPHQLTQAGDLPGKPHWAGTDAILFLAMRGSDDEQKNGAQVWRLPLNGGEAEKLSHLPGGRTRSTPRSNSV
jgi:dipeptidyl aminopeptidase/acylaminoacyl peptidase